MALLRSVATVGSYTLLSRVFGFIRDVLTAAILGAGPVADAFFVAQRLPNLFRSLFAEGAFSAAFVPLFAGTMAEHGKEAARVFAEDASGRSVRCRPFSSFEPGVAWASLVVGEPGSLVGVLFVRAEELTCATETLPRHQPA